MPRVPVAPSVRSEGNSEDPAELLDVEVDELARSLALVAPRRLARLQVVESGEAEPLEVLGDRRRAAVARAICWPVQRWRRSRGISATTADGVACGKDRACEDWSAKPAGPSARKRASHLNAVRVETPSPARPRPPAGAARARGAPAQPDPPASTWRSCAASSHPCAHHPLPFLQARNGPDEQPQTSQLAV